MVLLGSEVGLPYTSSDLGGHTSTVTEDMYVRWIQYGALSPIMRVHCTKPYSRMPWLFGDTAARVTHTYADLRYRLLPVYYAGGTSSFKPQSSEVAADWKQRGRKDYRYLADRSAAAELVRSEAGNGDVVLVMGARDNSLSAWAAELAERSGR